MNLYIMLMNVVGTEEATLIAAVSLWELVPFIQSLMSVFLKNLVNFVVGFLGKLWS